MPLLRSNLKFVMVGMALGMIGTAVYPAVLSGFTGSDMDVSQQAIPLHVPEREPVARHLPEVTIDAMASTANLSSAHAVVHLGSMLSDHDAGSIEDATSYDSYDLGDEPVQSESEWEEYVLGRGDLLSDIWGKDLGLPIGTLYRLLGDTQNKRLLSRLRPGQLIQWRTDEAGYLTNLRIWYDRAQGVEWAREANGWDFSRQELQTGREISHMVIQARLDSSISETLARQTDLSRRDAANLANLLDRHMPVRARARAGDVFTLLVERETLPGDTEPLEIRLLAFEYRGEHINLSAARHSDNRFYSPDGYSLLPPFDRQPFSGNYRISSHFDLRRPHPITGRVAPHYGTDWAMPVGTSILAPADGRVVRVASHPNAGRYVVIEHGQGYTTRYLHLSRSLVRPGEWVHRGQRIALSGNTGRSTGPHLHYELHVSGRPVNPMRAELPNSDRLAGEELQRFTMVSAALLAELRQAGESRSVAMLPFSELAM